jgi:hypothetical protein
VKYPTAAEIAEADRLYAEWKQRVADDEKRGVLRAERIPFKVREVARRKIDASN